MYGDATSTFYSSDSVTNIKNAVNEDLDRFKKWLQNSKLPL